MVNILNIEKDESIFCDAGDETDPLLQYFKNSTEFSFVPVDKAVIAKEIKNLDTKKADHKMISQSRC